MPLSSNPFGIILKVNFEMFPFSFVHQLKKILYANLKNHHLEGTKHTKMVKTP